MGGKRRKTIRRKQNILRKNGTNRATCLWCLESQSSLVKKKKKGLRKDCLLKITMIWIYEASWLKWMNERVETPTASAKHSSSLYPNSPLMWQPFLCAGPTKAQGRCSQFTTCCVTLLLRLGPKLNPSGLSHCLAAPVRQWEWDVGDNYTLRRLALATPSTRISPGLLMQPWRLWPLVSGWLVSC